MSHQSQPEILSFLELTEASGVTMKSMVKELRISQVLPGMPTFSFWKGHREASYLWKKYSGKRN